MKKIDISDEELEMMNYNDVAHLIIGNNGKKMKIVDLFEEVCKVMKLNSDTYQSQIGDFFELLSTDKRFIMLEEGFWDLKIKHNKGMITYDDDEEDEEMLLEEEQIEEEEPQDDYADEDKSDDDTPEDDLADLVIIDDSDEENDI